MEVLAYLIPIALLLGIAGLGSFFWALKTGQFEDMDGAGMRILIDDEDALSQKDPDHPENDFDTKDSEDGANNTDSAYSQNK